MSNSNYNPEGDVSTFMQACGQDVPTKPTVPSLKTLALRCRLTFEEILEFIKAAGFEVCIGGLFLEKDNYSIVRIPESKPDLVEMYDAIVDINYVNYGAATALGLRVAPGHEEVHRSNMTKVSPDGTVKKNEHGKVVKPPTFSPADLAMVLAKQGYIKE